jgi:hypothetical protein
MPRLKTYRSSDEIMDIFKITSSTVNSIIKKYKIDSFSSKWKLQINTKDFYKAYVTHFNPSLFEVWEKKNVKKAISLPKNDNSDIFQKLFGSPSKNNTKRKILATALISAKELK